MEGKQEKTRSWQSVKCIFRVLYSPRKTLKEVAEKPDIKGPFVLLLLISMICIGTLYVSGSKLLMVAPTPETDDWTDPQAKPLWSSNGNITLDYEDVLFGNTSIVASISNGVNVWLNLTSLEPFNCTAGNFEVFSFQMKWISSDGKQPATAVMNMFSEGNQGRFELDITESIPASSDEWAYLTIDVGSKNTNFKQTDSPEWTSITGFGFLLEWTDLAANASLKVDAVYFGKPALLASTRFFGTFISSFSILTIFDFFLKWTLFSAGLWLVLKGFANLKPAFKDLFYTTGYCFSGLIVYVLIRLFLFLLIPPIQNFDVTAGYLLLVSVFIFNIWPVALGALVLRRMHEISGKRAILLSTSAYLVYFFVTLVFVFGISFSFYRALYALP